MKGSIFLDSNIILYAHSDVDEQKQLLAQNLISQRNCIISTQVIQEVANILRKKLKMDWDVVRQVVNEVRNYSQVYRNTEETILKAIDISTQYHFSFYDSIIVAAALEAGCSELFSEDLSHGQLIDNALIVTNPFF